VRRLPTPEASAISFAKASCVAASALFAPLAAVVAGLRPSPSFDCASLPASAPLQDVDAFEKAALEKKHVDLSAVPPRYRSSYFLHIWANGYAAGYYAYSWSEMLDDDAYQWFEDHGGLTRANGDRFRRMVLSKGNTQDLATAYKAWLGADPSTGPMLKDRGLADDGTAK
jgi:peptidyl-dipeptidase Dcp